MARVLLHELAHRYSSLKGELENDCSFLKAAGWNATAVEIANVSPALINRLRKEGTELIAKGKQQEAADWTRKKAQEHGFPTLYSMTNPTESFAELLTFYALDETSATYMKPSIVKWLDDNVLNNSSSAQPCPPKEM